MSFNRDENALKTISVAGYQDIMSDPVLVDLENERRIVSLVLFHSNYAITDTSQILEQLANTDFNDHNLTQLPNHYHNCLRLW